MQFKEGVTDAATSVAQRLSGNFQILIASFSPRDDPSDYLTQFFASNGGANYGRWNNPEIDTLLQKIDSETDLAKRKDLANQAERKVVSLAYLVNFLGDPSGEVYRNTIHIAGRFNNEDNYSGQYERAWINP